MQLFYDFVKTTNSSCNKCFAIIYAFPCRVDASVAGYLEPIGVPLYPLDTKLLKIETNIGVTIESRIDSKTMKVTMPKKFEQLFDLKQPIEIKDKIEKCLALWLEERLDTYIV